MPYRPALLATTALTGVLLAGSAGAPAAAQPAPVYTWTGMYIGANAGYGWGEVGISCTGFCERNDFVPPKPAGAIFGVQVGANYQSGMWVWGIESDFSAMLAKGTTSFPSVDIGKTTDQLTSRYDWLGTLRARGGIANGPALFYATGGLAAASVNHAYFIGVGDPDGFEEFESSRRVSAGRPAAASNTPSSRTGRSSSNTCMSSSRIQNSTLSKAPALSKAICASRTSSTSSAPASNFRFQPSR